MTHCRREVIHAQWDILLDAEFLEAYEHGIATKCCDGIARRFYPRIMTYSADYKEKYAVLPPSLGILVLTGKQSHSYQHPQQRAMSMPPLPISLFTCPEYGEAPGHEAEENLGPS